MASSAPKLYRISGPTNLYPKAGITMGDRSPKAVKKQANQKQAKTDTADQKKQRDLAAKAQLAQGKKK